MAQPDPQRPKLGLVLSGGGAKGLAHIGVLKVLEELGLYPDFIAGTSMGSLVGGLYAIGYRPDSLEQIINELNWSLIMSDDIPLDLVNFEEKTYFKNELVELSFRNGKLNEPGGLIQGQQIEELLHRLTLPVYDINHFDSLPIPYRCVAADIVHGRPVEFKSGSLPEAMRASMAIPSVFSPVKKDSMVLVDGGLIRNFPVQELKALGAEVIIGVYVGAKSEEEEELKSIQKILKQIAFMQSIEDYNRQLPYVDIYIEPDLGKYSGMNFNAADSIIVRGERAARTHFEVLQQLADSLDRFGKVLPPQIFPPRIYQIDRIEVLSNQEVSRNEVIGRSGLESGDSVTANDLKHAVETLYGTNRYEKVIYDLKKRDEEKVLFFEIDEKSPYLFKGSLIYNSYQEAGILLNLTFRDLLLRSSRLMFTGQISDNFRFRLDYLKYLDKQRTWFLTTGLQFNRDAIPSLKDGRVVEQFRLHDFPIDILLNHRMGSNLLFNIGGQLEFLSLEPTISSDPEFKELNYRNFNLIAGFYLNTLNRNILPRRGSKLSLEINYSNNLTVELKEPNNNPGNADSLFTFDPFPKITLQLESYIPWGRKSVLLFNPYLGILSTPDIPLSDFYLVGAPEVTSRRSIPFYGLTPNEFVAQIAIGINVGYQYFFQEKLMLGATFSGGFFGVPDSESNSIPTPDEFLAGAGLTFGYDSIVGPIKFSIMYPFSSGEEIQTKLKTYLSFGHRF